MSDVRERNALREYVRERYGLGVLMPTYSNLMFYKHSPPSLSDSGPLPPNVGNLLFRVRSVPQGPPQQFVILMTRMHGHARAGSVILFNRSIDVAHVVCGLCAPDEHFDDTIVEGEIESDGSFVASDILLSAGRPVVAAASLGNFLDVRLPLLKRWLTELQDCHRRVVGGSDFGVANVRFDYGMIKRNVISCPLRLTIPQWFETPQQLYEHVFSSSSLLPLLPVWHVVVRRRCKCAGGGKDAIIPIASIDRDGRGERGGEECGDGRARTNSEQERGLSSDPVLSTTPSGCMVGAPICVDEKEEVEEDVAPVLQQFYVHGTSMPDVYELYRECATVGVRGPDATAGVRSMRDSRALRDLIAGHKISATHPLPRYTFEFNEVIGRWTPHHGVAAQ